MNLGIQTHPHAKFKITQLTILLNCGTVSQLKCDIVLHDNMKVIFKTHDDLQYARLIKLIEKFKSMKYSNFRQAAKKFDLMHVNMIYIRFSFVKILKFYVKTLKYILCQMLFCLL